MTVQPNGTEAKDIALYFVQQTTGRATPSAIAKTITQAKSLLASGYTKDEVLACIDYVLQVRKIEMYSLGYINAGINSILEDVNKQKTQDLIKSKASEVKEQMSALAEKDEVKVNGESTQRNRDKLNRIGVQSGFGKKFNFDLFERSGQDH